MNRTVPTWLWWRDIRVPLLVFVLIASILAATHADQRLAHVLFFDEPGLRWVGGGSWWTNEVLHTGGRWAVRGMVATAILVWMATRWRQDLKPLRRPAAYFICSSILSVGMVGLLKTLTHVHCPWDLQEFGGHFSYAGLFSMHDTPFRAGGCFPAAHASTGYALMALYFALRDRSRALGQAGLILGIVAGVTFGLAQQSRGAHFLSHDVWSAFIVWTTCASLYAFAFKARLWSPIPGGETGSGNHEAALESPSPAAGPMGLRGRACGFPWPARE